MKNPEDSFRWIIGILQKHSIRFAVSGGLAARSYGALRPLNDIDIDIEPSGFLKILQDVRPFVTFGPAPGKDRKWDIAILITLNHNGQEIDISDGLNTSIHDDETGQWIASPVDFSAIEMREIFGVTVPVMNRAELVAYKSLLNGQHQKDDITAIMK